MFPPTVKQKTYARHATLVLALTAIGFVITMIMFPDQSFRSSLQGITVWWKFVFPALLPFFIITELAIGFGIVHAIGTILEPLMRLCYRLPGISGWALASGSIGGFPTGAKATAELRKQELLTRRQGEQLLAISQLASPGLIMTVIAAAFLGNPALGMYLAVIHYASGLSIGLLWRSSPRSRQRDSSDTQEQQAIQAAQVTKTTKAAHTKALQAKSDYQPLEPLKVMKAAQLKDGRTFGKLLGDAVSNSVGGLMVVGGYIVMFSVILNVITMTGITEGLSTMMSTIVPGATGDTISRLIRPMLIGFLEPHLGAYAWSIETSLPVMWQAAGIAALLGWGGLSTHAQVRALTQETDLRYGPFVRARLLHSVLAALLTVVLWRPYIALGLGAIQPSFLHAATDTAAYQNATAYGLWPLMQPMLAGLALLLAAFGCIALLIRAIQAARHH